jgi:hypothetical protein
MRVFRFTTERYSPTAEESTQLVGNPKSYMILSREGNHMATITSIVKQLKKERDKAEKQLSGLNKALAAFVGAYYGGKAKPTHPRRQLSAKARAAISAAQKARWAKVKAKKKAA